VVVELLVLVALAFAVVRYVEWSSDAAQAEFMSATQKGPGVSNTCDQSGRQHWADPGDVMKALARLVGPVPSQDHPIELNNLLLEAEQLGAKSGKAGTGQPLAPACHSGRQQRVAVQ
jgi:hypothetical protein